MTDPDFERKVNPWLFDSSGKSTNADTLHGKFDKACKEIWTKNPHFAEDITGNWAIVKAIAAMGQVWGGQVSATSQMMGDIATALGSNADQYARVEQANAQNLGTT